MTGTVVCPTGTLFYQCSLNKFRGCCAVDPCALPEGCPPEGILKKSSSTPSTETKTDSGVTHTIPNSSTVTVTQHTVVVSEIDLSSVESTSSAPSSVGSTSTGDPVSTVCTTCGDSRPKETAAVIPATVDSGGGISKGAIAGAAIGGVAVLAILIIIFVISKRRKRAKESNDERGQDEGVGAESRTDAYEKNISPHTTGTGGSGDPFAPFGGRADLAKKDPHPPPSGMFEMDGTGIEPVELPAESVIAEAPGAEVSPAYSSRLSTVSTTHVDPQANLASPKSAQGTTVYVITGSNTRRLSRDE